MASASLTCWQNDRMPRLNDVDAHCAAVLALAPMSTTFLDETLRGYVLHLSAHFQGFCRDLYTECPQIWIAALLRVTKELRSGPLLAYCGRVFPKF